MAFRRFEFDGGMVEYLVAGPPDAPDLLLLHVGTPAAGVMYPGLVAAAAARGMRTATYSRAGYGASDRRPGRVVADEAPISAALADLLGYTRFLTVGWSGGGPAALACAALLPERVLACMALASVAPPLEVGPTFASWLRPEDRDEWEILSSDDQTALLGDLEELVRIMGRTTQARRAKARGRPDARALAYGAPAEIGPFLTRSIRRAVSRGYFGYLDDSIAQAHDWGFRVAEIRVPVVVRHGELDRLVDVGHGRWLAKAIPGARGVFLEDAGHGSIALPWAEVVAELLRARE
jgi:pimeloyl-ACP methyl ester carboxylesterase